MSGMFRQMLCFSFIALCMGSLWLLAAAANVPAIPPWHPNEPTTVRASDTTVSQAEALAASHDYLHDVDVDDTTAAAFEDDDS